MKVLSLSAALLTVSCLVGQDASEAAMLGKAEQSYQKLVAEYDVEVSAWNEKIVALQEQRKMFAALARTKEAKAALAPFADRFQELAERFAGTEGAVSFLTWIALHREASEAIGAAVETLLSSHINSVGLLELAGGLPSLEARWDRCDDALSVIADQSPHVQVRAQALYGSANMILFASEVSDQARQEALKIMDQVAALVPGTDLALSAGSTRFARERLQIGMTAPDIAGEDLDGVAFKLSDYRGKVVVLDFWGDW